MNALYFLLRERGKTLTRVHIIPETKKEEKRNELSALVTSQKHGIVEGLIKKSMNILLV